MNKRFIAIIITVMMLLNGCVAAGQLNHESGDDAVIISVVLYPEGHLVGAYFISVSSDGVLTTDYGSGDERLNEYGFSLVEADFSLVFVWETGSVELTPDHMQRIFDLTEMISDKDFVKREIQLGGWYIDVIYNGRVFQYFDDVLYDEFYEFKSKYDIPHMRELLNDLIEYSPIPIVLEGFS